LRVEVDGREPSTEKLRALALDGYGHFTAMQVRSHRVQGLDLHLRRLREANRVLFDRDLDSERVRDLVRHALTPETPDASVRVRVQWPQGDDEPCVMVTVNSPGAGWDKPVRLQSVPYQRTVAHIKRVGDFGQGYYGRQAERNGFDEALLTGDDGVISEGSITNVGFFDGTTIVWPSAPVLLGITMQLVQIGLTHRGVQWHRRPVGLADVSEFAGAFVTNSRGIVAVREIDDRVLPIDSTSMALLTEILDATPWDEI
jgi:branched-subunit amino acid aminotransferase/4-amino-4-deoxychorismate lyase